MELIVFVYVGFTTWDVGLWRHTNFRLALGMMGTFVALIFASRLVMVMPLCAFMNCYRSIPLTVREIFAIAWAGVMRGAVSTALVFHFYSQSDRDTRNPTHAAAISSTLLVVLTSTVLLGGVTKPLLAYLLGDSTGGTAAPEPSDDADTLRRTASDGSAADLPLLGAAEERASEADAHFASGTIAYALYKRWTRFDAAYLQPVFGGQAFRHARGVVSQDDAVHGGGVGGVASVGPSDRSEGVGAAARSD